MSLLDKAIAAITPPESDEARVEARAKAEAVATPGDWLSQVLDHHRQIEAAFDVVARATDAGVFPGAARNAEPSSLSSVFFGTGGKRHDQTVRRRPGQIASQQVR